MTASVSYTVTGQIGNIVIDSPPVNALSHAVRQGIIECLKVAEAYDTEVVIFHCDGRTFVAGADITEFGKPPQAPALATVLEVLESHPKPVIAAIPGTALGGGLELALCCDYRLTTATAKVGKKAFYNAPVISMSSTVMDADARVSGVGRCMLPKHGGSPLWWTASPSSGKP